MRGRDTREYSLRVKFHFFERSEIHRFVPKDSNDAMFPIRKSTRLSMFSFTSRRLSQRVAFRANVPTLGRKRDRNRAGFDDGRRNGRCKSPCYKGLRFNRHETRSPPCVFLISPSHRSFNFIMRGFRSRYIRHDCDSIRRLSRGTRVEI